MADASTGSADRVEPLNGAPPGEVRSRWRSYAVAAGFLAPAFVFLVVWIVYPVFHTIYRSLFDRPATTSWRSTTTGRSSTRTRWSRRSRTTHSGPVRPRLRDAVGLVFAVLTERVRFSVAFKTVVFMPMAISLFAAGVIWRVMYESRPESRRGERRHRGREGRGLGARRALERAGVDRRSRGHSRRWPVLASRSSKEASQ